MSVPRYRVIQSFVALDAGLPGMANNTSPRGGTRNQAADPVKMHVRLVVASDQTQIVEEKDFKDCDRIYRLVTGTWAYEVPAEHLLPGQTYTAMFRYEMAGGSLQVARQNIPWQPVPETPHQAGHCVLYGLLADANGEPFANEAVVIETYKDVITLNQRTGTATVRSDSFGYWYMELLVGSLVRVVLGDIAKVIKIPSLDRAALATIATFQPPKAENVDSFGYPKP